MGEVYLGHDDGLNRDVALKVMSRKLTDDPNFVARFKREAQAAASVSHANLVQIHELNETKGFHFFAMEYVEGDTIEELLEKEGYLPTAKALEYMEQAAKGLRAAAKKELIHRDIKPSNIMVNGDGLVKVTDFGLAKALQDGSNLTKTDVILGTPHYVSPEQARGERTVDFRSDMYSLGVTLFEALTGQLPFDATTPNGSHAAPCK
jgi:serine/threonine protein kinase